MTTRRLASWGEWKGKVIPGLDEDSRNLCPIAPTYTEDDWNFSMRDLMI